MSVEIARCGHHCLPETGATRPHAELLLSLSSVAFPKFETKPSLFAVNLSDPGTVSEFLHYRCTAVAMFHSVLRSIRGLWA
ncbi:hypothetical protein RB195_005495 [Necator americanus]|uniref:Uncharacterized protein n=1 Tax=Necator americanus TaxID=51031 RepID=A0ABR1BS20_NECAM